MDIFIGIVIGALISALLGVVFASIKDWVWGRFSERWRIRMEIVEERGPISREHGFTEKALKVTVTNRSEASVEIQDLRLMLAGIYGFPVLPEAPSGRSHSHLPSSLSAGVAASWYFPAEKLASIIATLNTEPGSQGNAVRLVPQVKTSAGKIYRGPTHQFTADVHAQWP